MSKKTYGIQFRCNRECNHSTTAGYPGKLKREVEEMLEDGVTIECSYCEEDNYVDTTNGVVVPIEF